MYEKRLMIDIICLRQAYKHWEITQVVWIEGRINIADTMTKDKPGTGLQNLLDSNKLNIDGVIR